VAATFDAIFTALEPLADEYRGLVEARGAGLVRDDLAALRPHIFGLLADQGALVAGAGLITTPGTLSDSRYWLEWWWTRASGTPEALRVNLDPAAPDFFDYTTAEWFTTPERTLARHVSGPYVDYACTNEYALTAVVPVHLGDRLVGLAAADVPVARLERQVLPALLALPRPMALVNDAGRVVAAASPTLSPGLLLPAGEGGIRLEGSGEGPSPATWRLEPAP
jgi:hypothetical protein